MISPKSILFTPGPGQRETDSYLQAEAESYLQADEVVRSFATTLLRGERLVLRIVVLFADLFVWTGHVSISHDDALGGDFIQRLIRDDWEFNAGVRPAWWPHTPEADRMWGVHYREDRDNGRAELARMRLERYELQPVALTVLPPRNMASDE
jgi:hypothetical protein